MIAIVACKLCWLHMLLINFKGLVKQTKLFMERSPINEKSYKSYNFFLLWNTKGNTVLIVFSVIISFASLFFIAYWFILFLQTSIFIPSYGATTNVHINSKMTTQEVITQLLLKFKVGIIITTGDSIHKPLNDYMCPILFCWT